MFECNVKKMIRNIAVDTYILHSVKVSRFRISLIRFVPSILTSNMLFCGT